MPVIRREVSIPANSTVDNLVSGSIYEFMSKPTALNIGAFAAATGVVMTINTGSDTLLEESPIPVNATDFPKIPDDMDVQDVAMTGERLVLKARNTTAGAIIVRYLVQLL